MIKYACILLLIINAANFSQNDSYNRYLLAQGYEQSGELAKARSIYEELYNNEPHNIQFFESLNDLYLKQKDFSASALLLTERIQRYPGDINLHGLLGSTIYQSGDEEKAFEVWESALENFSPNNMNYRIIANYAIERRAFDKAIEFLIKGKSASSDYKIFSYDLANLYQLTMRYDKAANEFCEVLSKEQNQFQLIEARILTYINKPDALDQSIRVFEDWDSGRNIYFDILLARLYSEKKDFEKAFSLYKKIDDETNSNGNELYRFGIFVFKEKEFNIASKIFEELLTLYPSSPQIPSIKIAYAKSLEELNTQKQAIERKKWKPFSFPGLVDSKETGKIVSIYNEVREKYRHTEFSNEASIRIARLKLLDNKQDEAIELFNEIINEAPGSLFFPDALEEMGKLFLQRGELEKSEHFYQKILASSIIPKERKNIAKYNLARLLFFKGEFENSKSLLSEVMNNLGDNAANDAIELSLLLNTTVNDSSNLAKFALAEFYALQTRFEEAAEIYREIYSNPQVFLLQSISKLREAEMRLALNNIDESIKLFQTIAGEDKNNIYADKALYLLGKISDYELKSSVKAIEFYEQLLARFPQSLYTDEARQEIIRLRNKLS
ncbi:MAG: tetratricopeptide repeat protein [Ignavibacteriaceae bacterium]|nr:tetratricopeptide repeat protein [Ignavibacteriaceae bacterium]